MQEFWVVKLLGGGIYRVAERFVFEVNLGSLEEKEDLFAFERGVATTEINPLSGPVVLKVSSAPFSPHGLELPSMDTRQVLLGNWYVWLVKDGEKLKEWRVR